MLSYITRVLRENGLTVAHADIETKGENATNVLYVQDISGNSNIEQTVLETIRKQLDPLAFQVVNKPTFLRNCSDRAVFGFQAFMFLQSRQHQYI